MHQRCHDFHNHEETTQITATDANSGLVFLRTIPILLKHLYFSLILQVAVSRSRKIKEILLSVTRSECYKTVPAGWLAGYTVKHKNCDTCTRTEPILHTQRTLKPQNYDTCTRTEPILQT